VHNSKGFSLIELVVVISVIAQLSTIIMGGYNRTVQSYKLSLLSDEFVSQLQSLKTEVSSKNLPICKGVLVDEDGVFFVESPYLNPVEKCDKIPSKVTPFADNKLLVRGIKIDSREIDRFTYYYTPPHGDIFFPFESINDSTVVRMLLNLKNTEKEREVFLIPATARFTDSNPANNE